MARLHNFSAGPAVLPESVLHEAQAALWELNGSGIGLLETSHRWANFEEVIASARSRLHRLMGLDEDQVVLFLHGGASTQFFQWPMNVLRGGTAAYLDTGRWAKLAIAEAKRFGAVVTPFSSAETRYDRVPQPGEALAIPEGTVYLHYTSNNTVAGTQLHHVPEVPAGVLRVCDMSSDILSRPMDGSKFDFIYAGAQKNLGPSGVTVVVVRRSLFERFDPNIPTMLRYQVAAENDSMYNTPNTFGIFVIDRVCAWIEAQGGLTAVDANNRRRAAQVYDLIDASGFWRGLAKPGSRSLMNLTFTSGDDARDKRIAKLGDDTGIVGLKGHKAVGGLRASLYNAQTDAAVAALCDFLGEVERREG